MVPVAVVEMAWVPPSISLHKSSICMLCLAQARHPRNLSRAKSEQLKLAVIVHLHLAYFWAGGIFWIKCMISLLQTPGSRRFIYFMGSEGLGKHRLL
jgi:hypothetical protein